MTKKISFLNFVIYFSLFVYFVSQNIYAVSIATDYNSIVVFLFDIIGLISFINFTIRTKKINIYSLVNFFLFFFFYYCALNQYLHGWIAWSNYFKVLSIETNEYIFVNITIIVFIIVLDLIYFINVRSKESKTIANIVNDRVELSHTVIVVLTIINVIVMLFFIKTYGFKGLLTRYDSQLVTTSNRYTKQIIDVFLRFIPCSICIILSFYINKITIKKNFIYYIINFLILLLIVFPLGGTARYMIAAVYLSVFYTFIKKGNFKSLIVLLLIFGIVVVFPNINYFRFHSISELKSFKFQTFDVDVEDFDAYSMLIFIIKYAKSNGFALGNNFINAILFFVPRAIWSNKMVGTGAIVASSYNSTFTNVSAPLIAESYFSFGVLGVIYTALFLGLLCKCMDHNLLSNNILKYGVSCILFGMITFIMRGDFLSSFAYAISFILNFLLITFFVSLFKRKVI